MFSLPCGERLSSRRLLRRLRRPRPRCARSLFSEPLASGLSAKAAGRRSTPWPCFPRSGDMPRTNSGGQRPQTRCARRAEYRTPASRPGRCPLSCTSADNDRPQALVIAPVPPCRVSATERPAMSVRLPTPRSEVHTVGRSLFPACLGSPRLRDAAGAAPQAALEPAALRSRARTLLHRPAERSPPKGVKREPVYSLRWIAPAHPEVRPTFGFVVGPSAGPGSLAAAPSAHTSTLAAEHRPSSRKGLTAGAMRPQTQSPV
jgi:hypothetical protein